MYSKVFLISALAFLLPSLKAQIAIPITAAAGLASASSDTVVMSSEYDRINPQVQGASGSFQWIHATQHQLLLVGGVTYQTLGTTHWTLGQAGAVYFHSRWILETSLKAGHGATGSQGFAYNDVFGAATYRISTHFYATGKEEYINIATSKGSLIRGALCVCSVHRFSTTVTVAHSAFGNLATEYVSVHEDTIRPKYNPFVEVSVGKTLPTLVSPALGIYSPSAHILSVAGGARLLPAKRNNVSVALSYVQTGQVSELSIGLSLNIKVRGD